MIKTAMKWAGHGLAGHQQLVGYYNANCLPLINPNRKYKMSIQDNWCAMFTTCMAHMCGVSPEHFPYEVSVTQQVAASKMRGWYFGESAKVHPNDLVFFDWKGNGTFAHVGFVLSVDGRAITTIEGNHKSDVGTRTLDCDSPFFAGFARTPFQEAEEGGSSDIESLAKEVIAGKYGNGTERKERLGDSYDDVQKWINSHS